MTNHKKKVGKNVGLKLTKRGQILRVHVRPRNVKSPLRSSRESIQRFRFLKQKGKEWTYKIITIF